MDLDSDASIGDIVGATRRLVEKDGGWDDCVEYILLLEDIARGLEGTICAELREKKK